jgi:hypothetical protein
MVGKAAIDNLLGESVSRTVVDKQKRFCREGSRITVAEELRQREIENVREIKQSNERVSSRGKPAGEGKNAKKKRYNIAYDMT